MKFIGSCFLSTIFAIHLLHAENTEERRAAAIGVEMESFSGAKDNVYRDVRISRIDDGGISIRHASGTARLRYEDLTPSQRKQFGIDRESAVETYRLEASLRDKYENAVAEKEKLRTAAANERYKAKVEAEEAEQLALEQEELSTPIPNNPPVILSQAVIPQKSVTYRIYSNYGYNPNYRPFCTPRSYRYGSRLSYRSPHFSIIIR